MKTRKSRLLGKKTTKKVNLVIPILALVIGLLNVALLILANLDKIIAIVG